MRSWHLIAVWLAAGSTGACVRPLGTHPTISPEARARLYARTTRQFQKAVFFKPDDGSMSGRAHALAPLVVQQVGEEGPDDSSRYRFGALRRNDAGQIEVTTSQPTLYVDWSEAVLNGVACEQVVYLWFYPAQVRRPGYLPVTCRGFRMTLNRKGSPIVWEVLPGEASVTLVFVARSLEQAAAETFGPPLAGRRFSVERSVEEQPDIVVVRVLEEGPEPMGPIVYLDARSRSVTTFICRCMPSQVRSFIQEVYYDLRPMAGLGLVSAAPQPCTRPLPTKSSEIPWPHSEMTSPDWLQRALRLPPDFY